MSVSCPCCVCPYRVSALHVHVCARVQGNHHYPNCCCYRDELAQLALREKMGPLAMLADQVPRVCKDLQDKMVVQ